VTGATTLTTLVGARWHTAGALAIVEVGVMSAAAIVCLIAAGELKLPELALTRSGLANPGERN
jgi:hypothetical protein